MIMASELKSLQLLVDVSKAIIETPSLSISDFGIKSENNKLIWSGVVSDAAKRTYTTLAGVIAASACVGSVVTVSAAALGSIGFSALAGLGASAAGASLVPGIGWTVAAFIAAYGISRYLKAKKQQQEKERMYREIIKQQQAAISKHKKIITELEDALHNEEAKNAENRERISKIKRQIANLEELIDLLNRQLNNFKTAQA